MSGVYGKDMAFFDDFVVTDTGDFDTVEGLENVKQALWRRLITTPGSVIHRPDYGVGIKNYQNSINSLARQREISLKIKEQFELDERVESVTGISFSTVDNYPDKLIINVKVKIIGFTEQTVSFAPFEDVG